MAKHEQSITVNVPPDRLFSYLSDVRNLPRYLPQMTSAEPVKGGDAVHVTARIDPDGEGESGEREVEGEAWFRVNDSARSLEWGSEGPNDYHGALEISADGTDSSTLTVSVTTERAEDDDVDGGLTEALRGIKVNAEEDDSSA